MLGANPPQIWGSIRHPAYCCPARQSSSCFAAHERADPQPLDGSWGSAAPV